MSIIATQAKQIADSPIWPAIQNKLKDLYIHQLVAADVSNVEAIITAKNKLNVLEDVFVTITNECYNFATKKGESNE